MVLYGGKQLLDLIWIGDVVETLVKAGFSETAQEVHHGLAPFLLTEGVAGSGATPPARPRVGVRAVEPVLTGAASP